MATRSLLRCADNKDKFLAITFHTIRARGMRGCTWDAINQEATMLKPKAGLQFCVMEDTESETGGDEGQGERVSQAQFRILKLCVTAWRFQHMDSIALTYEEFENGMKELDYFPPIIVSKNYWDDYVVRYKKLCYPNTIVSCHKTRIQNIISYLRHIQGHMTFFEIPQVRKP
jgi:hypothetical protein